MELFPWKCSMEKAVALLPFDCVIFCVSTPSPLSSCRIYTHRATRPKISPPGPRPPFIRTTSLHPHVPAGHRPLFPPAKTLARSCSQEQGQGMDVGARHQGGREGQHQDLTADRMEGGGLQPSP